MARVKTQERILKAVNIYCPLYDSLKGYSTIVGVIDCGQVEDEEIGGHHEDISIFTVTSFVENYFDSTLPFFEKHLVLFLFFYFDY